ncbi:MAG: hypothetical protein HOH43_13985 [Candidatus Latescibacteria bacterium]|nr:hypothetical protein [Candidatus Latescibacterota bacterium]
MATRDIARALADGLRTKAASLRLDRNSLPVLIFFHGQALAHTIRPLVLARALRNRGYPVVLAGRGPHVVRVRQEGFEVHDVETLPQSRMDQYVERGDYGYYDVDWIDRCVAAERTIIQMVRPSLIVHDMKPTAHISARLEGVDDARITQAYNHPAYAHPLRLPAGFDPSAGPFDAYLETHAPRTRPQKSFFFLADVPQLHDVERPAPGYHFIGPLLDQPARPSHVDVLDNWSDEGPLVYLTCGSSGRDPDYLAELVEAVRDRPYRLLVTTANRWTPRPDRQLPTNVRVVPFLSGEWILQHASMLVGIVGVGAIYQALSQGKPIVGAPEHLDQEFHLNRVRDLGLGIKLDRADFCTDSILQAIDHVLLHESEFHERCAPFAAGLAPYAAGVAAVDLVDQHFLHRDDKYRFNAAFGISGEEFVRYLEATTPTQLSGAVIQKMLLRNLRRGLPHRWVGDSLVFDRVDSWNWLYENEPIFFEADYRALELKRHAFHRMDREKVVSRNRWQRYRLRYRLTLDPLGPGGKPAFKAGQRLKVFLPIPVDRPGHQRGVNILQTTPSALTEQVAHGLGFIYGAIVTIEDPSLPLTIGYDAEVNVRAIGDEQAVRRDELSGRERTHRLQVDESILHLPEVLKFRAELDRAPDDSDEATARAIYRALATTRRFGKTHDRTQSPKYCTSLVLRSERGHCTTLARTFATLCRAEGIPTREVHGALIGYPLDEKTYLHASRNEPLFGHTWVEIFLSEKGWVPVEFHGIVIGQQAMTGRNVRDRRLRRQIEANTEPYLDYYFGHLDHQRILCSPSVKRMHTLLLEHPEERETMRGPWRSAPELRYDNSLRVDCL